MNSQDQELASVVSEEEHPKRCINFSHRKFWPCFLLVLSGLAIFIAAWTPGFIRDLIDSEIEKYVILDSEDAPGFDDWKSSLQDDSPPVWQKVYAFNLLNPEDVLQGAKPEVVEMGPWAFRQHKVMMDFKWHDGGDILEYNEYRYFVFDPEQSFPGAEENDKIWTANIATMGVKSGIQASYPGFWRTALNLLLRPVGYSPIMQIGVRDLYFGYFDDPLLAILAIDNVDSRYPGLQNNFTSVTDMYRRRGPHYIFTGKHDIKQARQIIRWGNMTQIFSCPEIPLTEYQVDPDGNRVVSSCPRFQTEWESNITLANENGWLLSWGGEDANTIWGTDATQFYPDLDARYLRVHVDDIYRGSSVEKKKEVTFKGIKLYRYGIVDSDMLNATHNPDNEEYYAFGYDGLLNITRPAGAELFVSKAHFLDADPAVWAAVDGISPDPSRHDLELDIEPNTGATMRARKRLQLNAHIYDWNDESGDPFDWTIGEPFYLPLVYVEEIGEATDDLADEFKTDVYDNQDFADDVETYGWGVAITLMACTTLAFGISYWSWRKEKMREKLPAYMLA